MRAPVKSRRPFARGRGSRGFSFTEVLFAVMILGIGFIMVAAIFPVAIQQATTVNRSSARTTRRWSDDAEVFVIPDSRVYSLAEREVG